MRILGSEVIPYAREWLGTPWHHNQALKGVGVDCIRFTMDVYSHFGAEVGKYTNYNRVPRGNSLLDYIDSLPSTQKLLTDNPIEAGQLIILFVRKVPHHAAIATSSDTMIHADISSNQVIEQPLNNWSRRIAARYNFVTYK